MKVIKTMSNQVEIDKELFTALNECKSADETRFFMTQPFYEKAKNRISATDGRRLFVYNLKEKNDLKEGFYLPVKQGKQFYLFLKEDMEGTYPNIDRVIPDYSLDTEYKFTFCSKLANCSRDIYFLTLITGPLNIEYLKPVHGIPVYCSYSLSIDNNRAIVLQNGHSWQYVIMPMQSYDDKESAELKLWETHIAKFID